VLPLVGRQWTIVSTHVDSEVVRAEPFTDIGLELGALWAD
jgi:hypothetical protein